MTAGQDRAVPPESAPLQPALRLIHCVQKERGASCALIGSLAPPNAGVDLSEERPFGIKNLRSARVTSDSAISSFYRSTILRRFSERNENGDLEIAAKLFKIREMVDGGAREDCEYLFFHDVMMEYNSILSIIIQAFVVNEVSNRKKELQEETNDSKMRRRNVDFISLFLDLILSFVMLKESLGIERSTLSGLMAKGITEINDGGPDVEVEEEQSNHRDRLNLIINDLVMVVENQDLLLRDLQNKCGMGIRSHSVSFTDAPEANTLLFDENYSMLLQLVRECIVPTDVMHSLQDLVRKDFDIVGFQNAMSMGEFYTGITLYMDRLHCMELSLLEELENCEGTSEGLDLLALGRVQPSQSISHDAAKSTPAIEDVAEMAQKGSNSQLEASHGKEDTTPFAQARNPSVPSNVRSSVDAPLANWEISLYDVEFRKQIGKGSAGTTYLGRYCQQDVAVKVAMISDMGLEGWKAELMSLKELHHTNITRFLGAIYNPSPLTYCLVLEYCDGGDLSAALAEATPPKFFIHAMSGVANGLQYLHKMKYMHRDIKPGNVLLSGDLKSGHFVAKLTDFGLAVKIQNASVKSGRKDLTAETGTYRYMAPEVIRHERYDYAADVYSLGLLMWETITRERPFEPKSQIEAAGSVALDGERPPFPDGTPFVVRILIEKCWAGDPDKRMEMKTIIESLDGLNNHRLAQSWLAAPKGHPVYKATQFLPNVAEQTNESRSWGWWSVWSGTK